MDTPQLTTATRLRMMIDQLAQLRELSANLAAQLKAEQSAFEGRPEIIQLRATLKDLAATIEETTAEIRTIGLTVPHPACTVKNFTEVIIDEQAALEWARVKMPVAITEHLDLKLLTDYAEKNAVPWAKVNPKRKVLIASDLSKYRMSDPVESQPEPEQVQP